MMNASNCTCDARNFSDKRKEWSHNEQKLTLYNSAAEKPSGAGEIDIV